MLIYFFQKMIWTPFVSLSKFFIRFKVEGQENFKLLKNKRFIVIANHRNYIDPFLVCASVPFFYFLKVNFRYMALPKYCKMYPFILLFGAYPIYKKKGAPVEEVLAYTEKLIKKGKNILIFPEGKIARDDKPAPAHRGIAYLSKKYNLEILPVAISGSLGINPKTYFLRRKKVFVKVGKPFYYQDAADRYDDDYYLAGKIMERVNVML